jgi:hypothetical protein
MGMTREPVLLFPARVRGEVLDQHKVLRQLLHGALEATTRGLPEGALELAALADTARELRRRFHAHLTFEERALLPVIARDELWGPERASSLREEHVRQRSELDTLVEGIESGWDLPRLALALRSLVVDLVRDMDEEEQGTLRLDLLEELVLEAR